MIKLKEGNSLKSLIKLFKLSGKLIIEDGRESKTLFSYFIENEIMMNKEIINYLLDNNIFTEKQIVQMTIPLHDISID